MLRSTNRRQGLEMRALSDLALERYTHELRALKRLACNRYDYGRLVLWMGLYHLGNHFGPARLTTTRLVQCDVNGRAIQVAFRPGVGDMFTLYEVLGRQAYRLPEGLKFEVKTIVDLGANIGLTSSYFSTLFPSARTYCLEPDPDNFRLLTINRDTNGFAWTCLERAVGAITGTVALRRGDWSNTHRVLSAHGAERALEVQSVQMQDLLKEQRVTSIDLLKVDIEGSEEELFRRDSGWLRYVKLIIAEFHPNLIDYQATVDAVKSQGFRYYRPQTLFKESMDMFMREDVAI